MVPTINMWVKDKLREMERDNERRVGSLLFFFFFFDSQWHLRKFWKVMSFNSIFTLSLGLGLKYKGYEDLEPIFKPKWVHSTIWFLFLFWIKFLWNTSSIYINMLENSLFKTQSCVAYILPYKWVKNTHQTKLSLKNCLYGRVTLWMNYF